MSEDKPSGSRGGRWSKVAARAVFDRNLTATDVRVLAAIGTYADREGIAWPSQETLATAIGIQRETVCKAIKRLRALGYLDRFKKRTPRGHFRNVYQLLYPDYVPLPARTDLEECDRAITNKVAA